MIRRGEVRWADLPAPLGSEPGHRRPVVVVQADSYNRSRIATTLAVALTENLELARAPGNVLLPADVTGLPKDSVANLTQLITADRRVLSERMTRLSPEWVSRIDDGLRLVLSL